MKKVILILTYLLSYSIANAQLYKTTLSFENDDQAFQILANVDEKSEQYFNLKVAKKFLISGDISKAKHFIERIDAHSMRLDFVRNYYMALIYFVEGNYKKSLDLLSIQKYYNSRYYHNICTLKVMNMIALQPTKDMNKEFEYCQFKTEDYSPTSHLWLKNLVAFKSRNLEALRGGFIKKYRYVLSDIDTIRVWLKTGLYLNKEKVMEKYLSSIPQSFYEYGSIRELIGLVHYRLGNFDLAQSFIEDLSSPNAENIRGNIKLINKEYELAFGHFKLALSKKKNSINSLERILTLSWILEQWKDGEEALENLTELQIDPVKKRTMKVAFMLERDNYKFADASLHILEKQFPNKIPSDIQLLRGFYGLKTGQEQRFYNGSEAACTNFDGLSCWWLMKSFDFPELHKTITRDDSVAEDFDINLDKLKNSRFKTPLNEIQYIHQGDIEEMDGLLVKITSQ